MDFRFLEGKSLSLVYIFYIILVVISITSFILTTINYINSSKITESFQEEEPDIYITGLKKVEFTQDLDSEYHEGISNLGNTGELKINCYLGTCKYNHNRICIYKTYHSDDTSYYDDSASYTRHLYSYVEIEEVLCKDRKTEVQSSCSTACRIHGVESCGSFYCRGDDYNYEYISSSCANISIDEENEAKSCGASNLIMFWKSYKYKSTNYSSYGTYKYSTHAITSSEKCEGGKICGILDDLGNKLCLPQDVECPINLVTTNFSLIKTFQHYDSINLYDKIIYYTNESVEQGRIIEGFYVDSDLLIKYPENECEIVDTWSISELIHSSPNKLYQGSLDYDPYQVDNIDAKGKSYLKICGPGVGKNKNIETIKQKIKDKNSNDSFYEENIRPIKIIFIISFFVSLVGYILLFTFLIIFICSFLKQRDCMSNFLFLGCYENQNCCIIIILIVSSVIILAGAIVSMFNIPNFSNIESSEPNINIDKDAYNSLKIFNFISFSMSIILVICSSLYLLYLKNASSLSGDGGYQTNISMKLVNNPSKQE